VNGKSRPEAALRVLATDSTSVADSGDVEERSCTRWCTTVSLEVHKRLAAEHKLCPCPPVLAVVSS
jgi:hypothetical protein